MTTPATDTPASMHLPCLMVGLIIMVAGTFYPFLMAKSTGVADHGMATCLMWAMSAGFIRGIGFVPRFWLWRGLFSGWACSVALGLALALKLTH